MYIYIYILEPRTRALRARELRFLLRAKIFLSKHGPIFMVCGTPVGPHGSTPNPGNFRAPFWRLLGVQKRLKANGVSPQQAFVTHVGRLASHEFRFDYVVARCGKT